MNDNYPPGVTGREPQIAGPDEFVLERACTEDALFVSSHILGLVGSDVASEVRSAILAEHTITVECGWTGDVDAWTFDHESIQWECPRCGAKHCDYEPGVGHE